MEDVEMELLTEHLSRSYGELQQMSSQYNTIVKEKRKLEGQLMMNEVDLERHKCQLTAWEEKFCQEKTLSLKKQTRTKKWMHTLVFENEQGRETIKLLEAETYQLRMKLLYADEEIAELKTQLRAANSKKEQEKRYREEIGASYKNERKQSARLSLQLKCQEDDLQALEHYKRVCSGLEFSNKELKDENEKLHQELNELSKWTTGLKDCFDEIENDNIRSRENNLNVTQNLKALEEEISALKQKSCHLGIENDFLKFRVTFLEKDCVLYKLQRNNAMMSRDEAAGERDKAWRDRELAWQHYIDIQKSRDSEIEKRDACMKELDDAKEKYSEIASKLAKSELKLNETMLMVDKMKLEINDTRKTESDSDEVRKLYYHVDNDRAPYRRASVSWQVLFSRVYATN